MARTHAGTRAQACEVSNEHISISVPIHAQAHRTQARMFPRTNVLRYPKCRHAAGRHACSQEQTSSGTPYTGTPHAGVHVPKNKDTQAPHTPARRTHACMFPRTNVLRHRHMWAYTPLPPPFPLSEFLTAENEAWSYNGWLENVDG